MSPEGFGLDRQATCSHPTVVWYGVSQAHGFNFKQQSICFIRLIVSHMLALLTQKLNLLEITKAFFSKKMI